jgi:hypothetical protein
MQDTKTETDKDLLEGIAFVDTTGDVKKRAKALKVDEQHNILFKKPEHLLTKTWIAFGRLQKNGFRVTSEGCLLLSPKDNKDPRAAWTCWQTMHPKDKIAADECISNRCRIKECLNPKHAICELKTAHARRETCKIDECQCEPNCIKVASKTVIPCNSQEGNKLLNSMLSGRKYVIKKKKENKIVEQSIRKGKRKAKEIEDPHVYDKESHKRVKATHNIKSLF